MCDCSSASCAARRARRSATDVLVDSHPDEFALLLRDARAREGLRPMSVEPSADATPEPTPSPEPSTAGQPPDED